MQSREKLQIVALCIIAGVLVWLAFAMDLFAILLLVTAFFSGIALITADYSRIENVQTFEKFRDQETTIVNLTEDHSKRNEEDGFYRALGYVLTGSVLMIAIFCMLFLWLFRDV